MIDQLKEKLLNIIEPVCEDGGYELVDVHYKREQSGWVLRIFIDLRQGKEEVGENEGVSFKDCEILSREVSAILDVEDPIEHAYRLEVSSPGLDRPLRTAEHFRRFLGEKAKIAMARSSEKLGGRKRFQGTLVDVNTNIDLDVVIIEVDGNRFELPVKDVATATLMPDWDKLMRQTR